MKKRVYGCALPFLLALLTTGCEEKQVAAQTSLKSGFWVWNDYSSNIAQWSGRPLDYVYFQAGNLPVDRNGWVHIPSVLPTAQEYWAVFRSDSSQVPAKRSAELLGDDVATLVGEARIKGLKLAGIQLDIDVPTRSLNAYAEWLKLVKAELPPGMQLSVTGLLTWFEGNTGIGNVVGVVDEFVPQFYDLGDTRQGISNAIAAPIDAAKWGPIFNKFRKRYRIGVATFGRGAMVSSRYSWILNYISPIDIASRPAFQVKSRRIDTGETVVEFRATRKASFGYNDIDAGETVRFTLPTIESVRAGITGAAKMGGFCGGVIFFRWPSTDETLTMQPDAVLSVLQSPSGFGTRVRAHDGGCATVSCEDIFLESTQPVAATPTQYRLRSTVPFEYFLPDNHLPVRVTAPDQLELTLPAYCPKGHLRLGRAVTTTKAQFTIEAGAR